jgi:hypothetical protein
VHACMNLTSVFSPILQVTIKLYDVEPDQVEVPRLHTSIQQLLQDQSTARSVTVLGGCLPRWW